MEASRSAEKDLADAKFGFDTDDGPSPSILRRADRRLNIAANNLQDAQIKVQTEKLPHTISWTQYDNELEDARRALEDAESEKISVETSIRSYKEKRDAQTARIAAAQRSLEATSLDLDILAKQDPSARGQYTLAETAIDVIRLAPPGGAALLALVNLVIAFHSWTYSWLTS